MEFISTIYWIVSRLVLPSIVIEVLNYHTDGKVKLAGHPFYFFRILSTQFTANVVTRSNFDGKTVTLCFVVNFVANHVILIAEWVTWTKTIAISIDQMLNISNIPGSEVG